MVESIYLQKVIEKNNHSNKKKPNSLMSSVGTSTHTGLQNIKLRIGDKYLSKKK